MTIPKTIKIGNRTVTIAFTDFTQYGEEMANVAAFYDPSEFAIEIDSNITNPDLIEECFFHELVHAVSEYVQVQKSIEDELNQADNGEIDTEESASVLEEDITDQFSKMLLTVLKENELLA